MNNTLKRDKSTIKRSVFEAIKDLPLRTQGEVYNAILEYTLNFNEVALKGVAKSFFNAIKPQLKISNRQFVNGSKNKNKKPNKVQVAVKQKPKKFNKADFKKALLELGANQTHIEDWCVARDKKKGTYTKTVLSKFLKECQNHNFPVNEAVKYCAENGWLGFKVDWVNNLLNNNGNRNNNSSEPTINRQTASTIQQNSEGWNIN